MERPSLVDAQPRCEHCLLPADHPAHRPAARTRGLVTLSDDPDQPWAPAWDDGHHPFVAPPVTTAERLRRRIAGLELDLAGPVVPRDDPWTDADLTDLDCDVAAWMPPPSEELPPVPLPSRRPHRALAWVVGLVGVLVVAVGAQAATQVDVASVEERLALLEEQRAAAYDELAEAREELLVAQESLARLLPHRSAREAATARRRAEARRALAEALPAVVVPGAPVWEAGSVTERVLAVAYAAHALGEADRLAEAVARAAATAGGAVAAAEGAVVEAEGRVRDLRVRIGALERRIADTHEELTITRRAAAEALGIDAATERWRPLVARWFPPDAVDDALWVMWCESRGDPEARAWPRSTAVGLYQFLSGTWRWIAPKAGVEGLARTDPEASVRAAAWLYGFNLRTHHPDGPWGSWSCRP